MPRRSDKPKPPARLVFADDEKPLVDQIDQHIEALVALITGCPDAKTAAKATDYLIWHMRCNPRGSRDPGARVYPYWLRTDKEDVPVQRTALSSRTQEIQDARILDLIAHDGYTSGSLASLLGKASPNAIDVRIERARGRNHKRAADLARAAAAEALAARDAALVTSGTPDGPNAPQERGRPVYVPIAETVNRRSGTPTAPLPATAARTLITAALDNPEGW